MSYFWKILEQNFPSRIKEAVKGMRMCKDSKGVVFDVPSDLQGVIQVSGCVWGGCAYLHACVCSACVCVCLRPLPVTSTAATNLWFCLLRLPQVSCVQVLQGVMRGCAQGSKDVVLVCIKCHA